MTTRQAGCNNRSRVVIPRRLCYLLTAGDGIFWLLRVKWMTCHGLTSCLDLKMVSVASQILIVVIRLEASSLLEGSRKLHGFPLWWNCNLVFTSECKDWEKSILYLSAGDRTFSEVINCGLNVRSSIFDSDGFSVLYRPWPIVWPVWWDSHRNDWKCYIECERHVYEYCYKVFISVVGFWWICKGKRLS